MDDHTADSASDDRKAFGDALTKAWDNPATKQIRDVPGLTPGQRMPVIVGASHKRDLEAYLHQMHDVRIVDAVPVLR